MYEASKELISFSDENAFIWNKLFCEEGDKKHSYKSSGNNGLSSFYEVLKGRVHIFIFFLMCGVPNILINRSGVVFCFEPQLKSYSQLQLQVL